MNRKSKTKCRANKVKSVSKHENGNYYRQKHDYYCIEPTEQHFYLRSVLNSDAQFEDQSLGKNMVALPENVGLASDQAFMLDGYTK